MAEKLTIYLGDLVHNSVVKGPFTMPLNIGYIAAYANKYYGKEISVRCFKYPSRIIDSIKEAPPDILALGNYSWNARLNYKIIEFAKTVSKNSIAILGGPNFPVTACEQEDYLRRRPLVDFYVTNQGEPGFIGLLGMVLSKNGCVKTIKNYPVDGCVFLDAEKMKLITSGKTPIIEPLDNIPSPYLSGLLDEFFDDGLIPILETDRGCPYTCIFCAWGKTTNREVRPFSTPRVKAELDYIAKRVPYTNTLFLANANFGIFERDKELAECIKRHGIDSGYPRRVSAAWAKNTTGRIIDIAGILGDMAEITMSFQSMDPAVLNNIKRSNVEISNFMIIQDYFAKKGIPSTSEIILGLPGETKESHLNTLRMLFDAGAGNIVCYNCRTLKGTVLDTKEERERYGIKTKFRLYDIGFGEYNGIFSIESDEIVRSTNAMSEDDILFFRSLHWLIQFLWSYRYYALFLKYLKSENIHPVDFMLRLIRDSSRASPSVARLTESFEREARRECFNTEEEYLAHYSSMANFDKIMKGEFGKLNYKYMFKVLFECRDDFDFHMIDTAKKMLSEKGQMGAAKTTSSILDNLILYSRNISVDFDQELKFKKTKTVRFDYDIFQWEADSCNMQLAGYHKPEGVSYTFSAPDTQVRALSKGIRQFRQEDRNSTLRKMSEYANKADLFYGVCK